VIAIVDRERELSIESLQEIGSPLLVTVHENLGMAPSAENVAPFFELMAKLGMVENLASGGEDDLSVLVRQRLPAAGYVHNAQSDMCEAYLSAGIKSITIRTSVPDRSSHAPESVNRNSRWVVPRDPRYATHRTCSVEVVERRRSAQFRARYMVRVVIGPKRCRGI